MAISIERFGGEDIRAHKSELVELLRDAVDGGSSVNFVAPLDTGIASAFWDRVASNVDAGERIVLVARDGDQIVGTVQLVLATQPNGLHRAEVQKVLVHSNQRRKGIGTLLMNAIEDEARKNGRHLLVLDTERSGSGEKLYERVGYTRVGVIPQFALNFDGSALIDTVMFYKLLT